MLRLKELKKLYNLTQADLANVLGTKQQQISRYETEERELKASQIIELCKHYKISADWLLGLEEKELQREYLENAIKEQRIREKKRKIRRCMALFEIGILLLALFFVFFVLGR